MDFTRISSLRHLALIKVCAELWDLSDIKDSMAKLPAYSHKRKYKEWEAVENKVMVKVPELSLPESLKKEILDIIPPIGLEIYKWKCYLCYGSRPMPQPEEYFKLLYVPSCWTPQGNVERKKTAEALVKDDNLHISKRYALACYFCLEDDIKELWKKLPPAWKEAFYHDGHRLDLSTNTEYIWVMLWSQYINGDLAKLNGPFKDDDGSEISAYQYAFKIGVHYSNKAAVEHFLQKLTSMEREASLVWYTNLVATHNKNRGSAIWGRYCATCYSKPLCAEVLFFLLSQMNEEQQIKVLQSNPYEILFLLLKWPWQSFFMEAANHTRDFLSKQKYEDILTQILKKMLSGCKDYNYHKLFGEFFEQGPSTCKRYFIGRCASSSASSLLRDLFDLEDKGNIRLIFKNTTVEEREKIMLHKGKNICQCLILRNKWDLLEFFVEECLTSEDIMIKFKEEFQRDIDDLPVQPSEKRKYTKFYRILDDRISKNSKKRDVEEGTCPAKRLRTRKRLK